MGMTGPEHSCERQALNNGPSRKTLPVAPPSLHRAPFTALDTRTAGLVAKGWDLLRAVGRTNFKNVSRRSSAKLIAQLAVFTYTLGLMLDWSGNLLLWYSLLVLPFHLY